MSQQTADIVLKSFGMHFLTYIWCELQPKKKRKVWTNSSTLLADGKGLILALVLRWRKQDWIAQRRDSQNSNVC